MKVLVAVDDSGFADYIVDFVIARRWTADAEFLILHVVPSLFPLSVPVPPNLISQLNKDLNESAQNLVESVAAELRSAGRKVSTAVREGKPTRQILALAASDGCDVIVVGAHSRTGIEKFMLGSVSMAVASAASCSVLVVRHPSAGEKI
jgi:nucleotide-binding universal stress UspA family protein